MSEVRSYFSRDQWRVGAVWVVFTSPPFAHSVGDSGQWLFVDDDELLEGPCTRTSGTYGRPFWLKVLYEIGVFLRDIYQ